MPNTPEMRLPRLAEDAFAVTARGLIPINADPAFILRFLPDEIVVQVAVAYARYQAKVDQLSAQALQQQAEFHNQIAGIISGAKG
jgi:hypothetical protein